MKKSKKKRLMRNIMRAIFTIEGALNEGTEEDWKTKRYFQSLVWINDYFDHYYLGFSNLDNEYVIEWRGIIAKGTTNEEEKTFRVGTLRGATYVYRDAKVILKMIKEHKKEMKDFENLI